MARTDINRGAAIVWLGLILLVGAGLRLWAIGRDALWSDEALTVMVARYPLFDLMVRPVDPTPGLFYVLHGLLVPSDAGAAFQRLPAACAGIAIILAAFWLGKSALDRRAGLGVATLVAVSAPLIIYSREARAYSLLLLFITLAAGCFINAFPPSAAGRPAIVRPRYLIAFGLFSLLAIYTHLVGWLWAGPALLAALYLWRGRGAPSAGSTLAALAIAVILVLPEAWRLASYAWSPSNNFTWLDQPGPATVVALLLSVTLPDAYRPSLLAPVAPLAAKAVASTLILLTVGAAAMVLIAQRTRLPAAVRHRPALAMVIAILALVPLWAWLIGFVISPIAMQRTFLPAALAAFLGFAWFDRSGSRSWFMPLIVACYAAATALTYPAHRKPSWPGIVSLVERHRRSGEAVLLCQWLQASAMLLARPGQDEPFDLLLVNRDGMARIRVDDRVESLDRYDRLVWAPTLPAYADRPRPPARPVALGSTLVLRYECKQREWERVVRWLGPGQFQRLNKAGPRSALKLDRFTPAQSAGRQVHALD